MWEWPKNDWQAETCAKRGSPNLTLLEGPGPRGWADQRPRKESNIIREKINVMILNYIFILIN